jgi:hypothetical protein
MYAATHGACWPNNLFLLQRGQETLHPYMNWIFCSACFSWFSFVLTTYQRISQDFSLPEKESLIRASPPTFMICEPTQATALPVHTRFLPLIEYFPQVNRLWEGRHHKTTAILLGEAIGRRSTYLIAARARHLKLAQYRCTFFSLTRQHEGCVVGSKDLFSNIHSIALLPKP